MDEANAKMELRILLLEDNPADAELNERMLRKEGMIFTSLRVETLQAFTAALDDFRPDIILADYHLPGFDGLQALAIAREKSPQTPYIFVSGAMGEERAVDSIKQGATDYIIKDRLTRLPAAVQRALEEKKLQQQRREAEEKFRKISESAQDAIIMMTGKRISFWNTAAERIFGYTADEALGQELHLLLAPPQTQAAFAQGYERFQGSGEGPVIGKVLELTALRKGGEEFPVELSVSAVQLNGQWHAIGIARDITERKQAERALRDSENRFRNLVETTNDWVWEVDENTAYTYASPQILAILGYAPAEVLGKTPFDLMSSEEAKRVADILGQIAAAKNPFTNFENTNLHKDGHPVVLETSGVPIFDQQGKLCGYRGIDRDITERKKAQEKLLRSEARLNEAQRIALLGNWELDIASNALTWSDEIYRIFEINPEEFGASYAAFLNAIHPDDRALVNQAYTDSIQNHTPYDLVHRLLMRDGRVKYVHEICSSTYDANGKPLRSIGTVQDITELKRTEAQILRLNRTLRTTSACNENLVHARSEDHLLNEVCRDIVVIGGHLLAWVAYPDDGVHAVAHFGDEAAFQHHAALDLDPAHASHCLTMAAMRERRTTICNQLMDMPEHGFESLFELGVKAILALPLLDDERLYGVLTVFSPTPDAFDADEVRLMEELAADLAYGIDALRTTVERDRYLGQFGQAMKNTITAIARTLEMRDPYTAGHQQRVTALSVAIAKEMGLEQALIEGLYFGAMIHDIGKISVPAEILAKPGALSDLEYKMIQRHPMSGFDIVQGIEFPWPVADMIAQHHERLDGSGYPKGLKNGEILIEARIIAVADVVEAMTTHRPYRPALGIAAALEEIEKGKGSRYDPAVVDACVRVVKENDMKLPQL